MLDDVKEIFPYRCVEEMRRIPFGRLPGDFPGDEDEEGDKKYVGPMVTRSKSPHITKYGDMWYIREGARDDFYIFLRPPNFHFEIVEEWLNGSPTYNTTEESVFFPDCDKVFLPHSFEFDFGKAILVGAQPKKGLWRFGRIQMDEVIYGGRKGDVHICTGVKIRPNLAWARVGQLYLPSEDKHRNPLYERHLDNVRSYLGVGKGEWKNMKEWPRLELRNVPEAAVVAEVILSPRFVHEI